jgi:serine/threonine protein phosphatase PrpC
MSTRESPDHPVDPPTLNPLNQPVVTVAGQSDVGRIRIHNEDAYLVAALNTDAVVRKGGTETIVFSDTPTFMVVADGVGGAASGDIASLMATDTLLIQMRRQYELGRLNSVSETEQVMRSAIATANQVIYSYANANPRHHGMATTATLAMVFRATLLLAQVGDSRAYLIRNGTARQLTKDQSLVQRLVDAGELTEIEAEQSDRRNIILQALGFGEIVTPDFYQETLRLNDILVLCSDGLSTYVSPEDLARVILNAPDLGLACHQLIDLANERGGSDNITVVIAHFDQHHPHDSSKPDSKRQGLAARVRQWLR